jgi:hypothetical protein
MVRYFESIGYMSFAICSRQWGYVLIHNGFRNKLYKNGSIYHACGQVQVDTRIVMLRGGHISRPSNPPHVLSVEAKRVNTYP